MTNLDGLWLAIFIMTIVSLSVIMALFAITWDKIELIYDIVRKERQYGQDGNKKDSA